MKNQQFTLTFILLLPFLLIAQNQSSVKAFLSYGFPDQMTVSKNSEKVAWVINKEGKRNIWFAEGPDFKGMQLTSFNEDDGQAITNLIFTTDNKKIVFVRGSGPNRGGDLPNPALISEGVSRDIWELDIEDKALRKLATGSNPQLHPDGSRIAFSNRGQIYTVSIGTNEGPSKLFHARRGAGGFRWSPDGTKIAFVSSRGDHSFVGIYDLEKESYQYLSPSTDRDANPVWSPDGKQLVFGRTPNQRNSLIFEPHRSGLPWSVMHHDLTSNKTKKLWQAKPGDGSVFRSISASDQMFWGANDQIVIPYEGDGWTHLYALSSKNGQLRLLTPGDFEVQFASIAPDRKSIVYSSNQNDTDRQHIWQVEISGGAPKQLTTGNGVEYAPALTSQGTLAYLGSGPTSPAQAKVMKTGGQEIVLAPEVNDGYPSDLLAEPEQVIFTAADGMQIHGQLFKPKNLRPGDKRPAVLFFHGGSRRQMLLAFHHRGYYHNAYALNQYLASQGYIVMSVNYRSGIGYGMKFREAINYGATGASEFNDVLGAGLYLKGRSDVDENAIGLWGGSYGGYLTALGLARASDLFAAGVDIHGVHDWNIVVKNFIPSYNPLARPDWSKLAFTSSPMADIKTWKSPVLLIHGDDDRNVPFSETVDIVESLRKQGMEPEQLIFPDEVHGFLLHNNWVKAYEATVDFFDRKLKK